MSFLKAIFELSGVPFGNQNGGLSSLTFDIDSKIIGLGGP